VLTSRNVQGGHVLTVLLGGLNYQIEHHLFPSMPTPNLRHARPIVRDYCTRIGVTYTEASLPDSYRQALASSTRHRCTATQAPLQPSVTRDRQVRRRRTDTTRPGSDGNVVLLGFLVSVIAAIRRHDRSPSAARAGGRCCGRGPPVLGGSAGPPHADVELSDDVFDRVDGIVPPGTITKPGRRRVLAPAGRKVLGPSMRETCRVARAVRD
jgi:hypothetical protein